MFNTSSLVDGNARPAAWFAAIRADWAETMEVSRPQFSAQGNWAVFDKTLPMQGKGPALQVTACTTYDNAFAMWNALTNPKDPSMAMSCLVIKQVLQ